MFCQANFIVMPSDAQMNSEIKVERSNNQIVDTNENQEDEMDEEEVSEAEESDEQDEDDQNQLTDEEMMQFKKTIYDHPLFPLLRLMFEKCENVMQDGSSSGALPPAHFDRLMQDFVEEHKHTKLVLQISEDSVDEMILKALQVLCIHITEVQKVNELCVDFCLRYISRLKQTLTPYHLLQLDPNEEDDFDTIDTDLDEASEERPISSQNSSQVISGGTVYQMVQTPQGLVAQPVVIQPPQTIDIKPDNVVENNRLNGKRGILPKKSTQIMKNWLFQHINHPYPTEDEKRIIASQTNLSMLQVNNWFINGRRRILHPMMNDISSKLVTSGDDDNIEVSATNLSTNKRSRLKKPNHQARCFWPITNEEGNKDSQEKEAIFAREEGVNGNKEVSRVKQKRPSKKLTRPSFDASLLLKQHHLQLQLQQQLLSAVQQQSQLAIQEGDGTQQLQPSYYIFNPIDLQSILQPSAASLTSNVDLLQQLSANGYALASNDQQALYPHLLSGIFTAESASNNDFIQLAEHAILPSNTT